MYSFESFDSNASQEVCSFEEGRGKGKQSFYSATTEPINLISGDWGDIDYVGFDYGFNLENSIENGAMLSGNQQSFSEFANWPADMSSDMVSIINQSFSETKVAEISGVASSGLVPKMENPYSISLASLELLNMYRAGNNRLNGRKLNDLSSEKMCPRVGSRELSTEEVVRIAGTRYIQFSDHNDVDPFTLMYPFSSMLLGLTDKVSKDVDLVLSLLASAEKISSGHYDRASKLLSQCDHLSSNIGNPVRRIVYYFAEALREKIDRETGRISSKGSKENLQEPIDEVAMSSHPAVLALLQALPFAQVLTFTSTQLILDAVGSAEKVHLIDIGIRTGMHWTVIMQALSVRFACPLELLKITAVGNSQEKISETGERLAAFAKTLNLPFAYNMVIVSDMKELKEDMFEIEADESVAVFAPIVFRNMINEPECLENLMKVIRNLKPLVMAVTEVEANHNSPSFVNRFIEALFYFSAYFDSLETCMDRLDRNRLSAEETFFASGIRNIVAVDGSQRIVRHVGIDVWRSFITRFGFQDIEPSQLCLYQASLLVKQVAFGGFCTIDRKGKALTIGWKGTPLHSVSGWKCC